MAYNVQQKLRDNIAAIKICLEHEGKLSQTHIKALKKFSGFGHKALLWGDGPIETWEAASKADKELYPLYQELYKVLDDNLTGREYRQVLESMKSSSLFAFYTPSVVPQVFYEALSRYLSVESFYDPCAGSGVFVDEAFKNLKDLTGVKVYEKEVMTAKVLTCIVEAITPQFTYSKVHAAGFEESDRTEDGCYDLICSNIPFGATPVFDKACTDRTFSSKIHNYFFWKGLQKIKEGGILAYLVTNAFLDTVTNKSAREWLFMHSDFISLTCMPDNLMKDTGNTEAPSHFLVVRKNSSKTEMSEEEKLLCVSENIQVQADSTGKKMVTVSQNKFLQAYGVERTIGEIRIGTNQYGKPSSEVLWKQPIEQIAEPFKEILSRDFRQRWKVDGLLTGTRGELHQNEPLKNFIKDRDAVIPIPEHLNQVPVTVEEAYTKEDQTVPWEEDDIASTCVGCGVGMFGTKPFCHRCEEEGRTLPEPVEEIDHPWDIPAPDDELTEEEETERQKELAEQQGDAYDEEDPISDEEYEQEIEEEAKAQEEDEEADEWEHRLREEIAEHLKERSNLWEDRLREIEKEEDHLIKLDRPQEEIEELLQEDDEDVEKQKAINHDISHFAERMDNMFKPRSEWEEDLQEEPVQVPGKQLELITEENPYGLKTPREKQIMEAAIKVIDAFTLLENEENT